jgi:hypothetical protein
MIPISAEVVEHLLKPYAPFAAHAAVRSQLAKITALLGGAASPVSR